MKCYQRIITYGLMIAGSIGLLGGGCCEQNTQKPKELKPVHIVTIKVKSEKFQNNILDPDRYYFSANTEEGLRQFISGSNASTLDALIDPGDEVKMKLSSHNYKKFKNPGFNPYAGPNIRIHRRDILEINGIKL